MSNLTQKQSDILGILMKSYPSDLLVKGEKLFFENKIELEESQEAEGVFFLAAYGTRFDYYQVVIELDMENLKSAPNWSIMTSCDCPYFEKHSKCKHVAAAFHELNSLGGPQVQLDFWGNAKTKIIPIKPVEEKVVYPKSISVPVNQLDQLPKMLPQKKQSVNYSIINLQLASKGISYQLYLEGFYVEIVIEYDESKGVLSISHTSRQTNLISSVYDFLITRFSDPFLDHTFLTHAIREKNKKATLEELGLLNYIKDLDTALVAIAYKDKFTWQYEGELAGFKNLEAVTKNLVNLFEKEEEESGLQKLKDSELAKEAGKYNIGFGIQFNGYKGLSILVPLMGKGKKAEPKGLDTRIDYISDPFDSRLEQGAQLLDIFPWINSFNSRIDSTQGGEAWEIGRELFQRIGNRFPFFLVSIPEYGSFKLSKRDLSKPITYHEVTAYMVLTVNDFVCELKLFFKEGDQSWEYPVLQPGEIFFNGFGLVGDRFLVFQDYRMGKAVGKLATLLPMKFPKIQVQRAFEELILPLSSFLPLHDPQNLVTWKSSSASLKMELYLSEAGGLVIFVPKICYDETMRANPLDHKLLHDPATGEIFERDQEFETDYLEFIQELHPSFAGIRSSFYFSLSAGEFAEGTWFLEAFEKLKAKGVTVFGTEKINVKRYSPFTATVSSQFSSNTDWFGVKSNVSFGDESVPLSRLKKHWDSGETYIKLGDGSLGKIPEVWMKKMIQLLRVGELDQEEIRVSKIHFMLLEDWEDSPEFAKVQWEIEEKKRRMLDFSGIAEEVVPQSVKAELRHYQKSGLNWLNFLREFQWGGILADDMGLGKTLQIITLICQMVEENPSLKVLIIAPTTLLFNWKKELGKFAPHLDYLIHHGQRYETADELSRHQLVFTSYGLVINDLELLGKVDWDIIVADESQAIKNTSSLRYKAILRLRGKLRIALTGTPIENGIQELYAQMNFVNPGFFKSLGHFQDHYLKPLKRGDTDVSHALRKQIIPFVLRRTKKEVLTELPDKIEEFLYCEMGPVQRKAYEAKREEYRNFLLKKFDEEGADQSKLFVLEGLTRLRQICDSPLLTGDSETLSSAKVELLKEHILEKTGSHKILVFSQFVKMLDLIRAELDRERISYCYLDGQTSLTNREIQVNKFQEDASTRVFLISLKAGGTGLNLTAADYVYIVDPWWNPAVENQAIDRCYRMGQDKHVVAYRMICQDSIEEKIMDLQASKRQLAKDIIGEGEGLLASLNRESMLELFS